MIKSVKVFMVNDNLKSQIIDYVIARRCKGGGFCFYRLEEPCGADTFYGLSLLKRLIGHFSDNASALYLKNMQQADGGYQSIFHAYYSIKSLEMLDNTPDYDPTSYIKDHIAIDRVEFLPAGIPSIFRRLYILVDLICLLDISLDAEHHTKLIHFIMDHKILDGGFGYPDASLIETSQALITLNKLHHPISDSGLVTFFEACEDPVSGFINSPGTSMSYLEYIHAGLVVANSLKRKPKYSERCLLTIMDCQNRTGGFSRLPSGGIATLEYTWIAVNALDILGVIE